MPQEEITSLMVAFGRMEEKIDSIVDHLARLNGSVAKLQDASNRHESEIVKLNTESKLWAKLSKPALLLMAAVVGAAFGMQAHVPSFLEFLK